MREASNGRMLTDTDSCAFCINYSNADEGSPEALLIFIMKRLYLVFLLAPLLLAMPTNGYAEQSAILGTAVTNTTSTVEFSFDPSVLYIAVGTSELLQFFVSPGTAIDGSPICESSDPEIAPPSKVLTRRLRNGGHLLFPLCQRT